MLNFRLDWPPTVNTYWRSIYAPGAKAGVRVLLSQKGRKYKENAAMQMLQQNVARGLRGRVEVLIDAHPPDRRKRDLDNLIKPILDVLQDYGVFDDDEQVDILTIRRRAKGGYVQVLIQEIEPDDSLCT